MNAPVGTLRVRASPAPPAPVSPKASPLPVGVFRGAPRLPRGAMPREARMAISPDTLVSQRP
jgi:hypothetical protein